MDELKQKLIQYKKWHNLTYRQLGAKIGISHGGAWKICTNRTGRTRKETIQKVESFFNKLESDS